MYKPTAKQEEAVRLLASPATHCLLYGGSRSGKTFLILRVMTIRAAAAAGSRHAVLRFRFNHVKASIVHDTFPKMMELSFPQLPYKLDKTDWFAEFPNGSQIWFGGLDDKERTEKILGQEYVSIFLNECSQIPFTSRNLAVTRLAQKCTAVIGDDRREMRRKMYYDCNPPSRAHWAYQLFKQYRDPDSGEPLKDPSDYASMQINPADNIANLPADYLKTLAALPARMRLRFERGEFGDVAPGALWTLEGIERWRTTGDLPDMQRVVVAVDPSGSADEDNADNDEIGVIVAGLGVDGNGYLLEDLTLKGGPAKWGNVATTAHDRHDADAIVGEKNYGGEMVRYVIASQPLNGARKRVCKLVTASRGKAVRAEPIAALHEQGKIRHAGYFQALEDELCGMTTTGYAGEKSPNRADAYVWAFTELFPGIAREERKAKQREPLYTRNFQTDAWAA